MLRNDTKVPFYCILTWVCMFFSVLFLQWPDDMFMYLFHSLSLCPQRSVTGGSWSQETGHQPCQLWAKEVLSEGVYLWGGGPDALSWPHATAQRDDWQISYPDGSVAGVRGSEGKRTIDIHWTIILHCDIMFGFIRLRERSNTLLQLKAAETYQHMMSMFGQSTLRPRFVFVHDLSRLKDQHM